MSRIFVIGDIHGELEIQRMATKNWPEGKLLTKDDYVIILGDFGVLWKNIPDKTEFYWLNWLDKKPWTTLFVDGNHENHERLQHLKKEFLFDGWVGKVSDSVFHLKRGGVYNIGGKVFFTFGGALSIDKYIRTEFISWWKEEIPSHAECELGLINLEKIGCKVDYILTHTCPISIAQILVAGQEKSKDLTCGYLEQVAHLSEYKHWYFGHWHEDRDMASFSAVYQRIIEIK